MTLALELAKRRRDVVLVEKRREGEPPPVKANHVSARSMEILRRLDLATCVRKAGMPEYYPHDVAFRTSLLGREFARIHMPCTARRKSDTSGPDGWWPTPEPAHRVNQTFLEPVLRSAVAGAPSIRTLFAVNAESVSQNESEAVLLARDEATDTELEVRAKALVGCEGGHSVVRHAMGARFEGDAVVQRTKTSFLDCPDLLNQLQGAPAWGNFSFNTRRSGMVYAIDGRRTWLVHNYLLPEEDFRDVGVDEGLRAILGLTTLAGVSLLGTEEWTGRRMLADRFRDGRLFICGDAAHIWVPFGGYGMNAGLADAELLAWCLAAFLEGWGGPRILEAYGAERWPITDQVSKMAMKKAIDLAANRRRIPPAIEDANESGDRARHEFGERVREQNVEQYCAAGLNFGYFYLGSPVIAYDGEDPPAYTMGSYTPCAIPGARFPHSWIDEGNDDSLYDHFGSGFTLVDAGSSYTEMVERAARKLELPLTTVVLPEAARGESWAGHELYLCRGDTHVVWRCAGEPNGLGEALQVVSGWE